MSLRFITNRRRGLAVMSMLGSFQITVKEKAALKRRSPNASHRRARVAKWRSLWSAAVYRRFRFLFAEQFGKEQEARCGVGRAAAQQPAKSGEECVHSRSLVLSCRRSIRLIPKRFRREKAHFSWLGHLDGLAPSNPHLDELPAFATEG